MILQSLLSEELVRKTFSLQFQLAPRSELTWCGTNARAATSGAAVKAKMRALR